MPPNVNAETGHDSTQAGRLPLASRSSQNVHFSTTPLVRFGHSVVSIRRNGLGSTKMKLREL